MSQRVVFDTSTMVSAALRVQSVPNQALQRALATADLCACSETLEELDRVLDLVKFDAYLDRSLRREFSTLIRKTVHLFALTPGEIGAVDPPCRDSKDNLFLALAMRAGAEILVSSDEDLLVLNPWRGVAIIRPSAFLSLSDP